MHSSCKKGKKESYNKLHCHQEGIESVCIYTQHLYIFITFYPNRTHLKTIVGKQKFKVAIDYLYIKILSDAITLPLENNRIKYMPLG